MYILFLKSTFYINERAKIFLSNLRYKSGKQDTKLFFFFSVNSSKMFVCLKFFQIVYDKIKSSVVPWNEMPNGREECLNRNKPCRHHVICNKKNVLFVAESWPNFCSFFVLGELRRCSLFWVMWITWDITMKYRNKQYSNGKN